MTGSYIDFEGINLLTGFPKVVGKIILRNELGGVSNGYEISFAGGNSIINCVTGVIMMAQERK